ncbi:conjugal transfer protein TraF [Marinobacter sp. F3R08]|uniref:conjugal transfer protein TraF n=1 Tax=Marinobacter sp. F3R08 TaxID=2841559 RepID=UPI001C07F170|nr:conjugal transfer protein TraF [Marinobacter sp. F3R08]
MLFLVASGLASASQLDYPERNGQFIERGEEGWFWYEPVPEEEEPEKKPEVKPPEPSVETLAKPKKPEPTPEPVTAQPPAPPAAMSAEWFRKNIKKYKDQAWENPTPENVSAFLYVQKMAMNRSANFADVWKQVVSTDPMLDANSTAPTTTSGTLRLKAEANSARKDLLTKMKDKVGLIFFFNGSQYSMEQARTLDAIQQLYGIDVLAVSTDGSTLPEDALAKVVMDQGQSQVMGVRQVPATFVAFNDNTTKPIGVGMFARPLMENRILLVAQMNGAISDEEYMATQKQLKKEEDLIGAVAPNAYASVKPDQTDEDGFIPAPELLRIIRQETNK